MKVLLVSEYGALNGGEFSFLTALPMLQDAGFRFTAALPSESEFAELLSKKSVDVLPFSFHGDDGVRKQQNEIRGQLGHLVQEIDPAVVHANSLAASRIVGPVTAHSTATGVGYARDIVGLSRKAINDVNQLDTIVAVSQATADFHVGNGMDASKIRVIHNGVDLKKFYPDRCGIDSEAVPEKRICLCIGQIGMRKGLDLSLRMLAKVVRQVDGMELWIVGQRHSKKDEAITYEQKLRHFAKENFPPGAVHWLGRRSDIPQLMQNATLLVHAARQEPLGRVLLESAASGLPIITTDVGGTPEILGELKELMFSPESFDEAVPMTVSILSDANIWKRISSSLRSIAESNFSSFRAGEALVNCYHDAMSPVR